jgi:hypothetical protein
MITSSAGTSHLDHNTACIRDGISTALLLRCVRHGASDYHLARDDPKLPSGVCVPG